MIVNIFKCPFNLLWSEWRFLNRLVLVFPARVQFALEAFSSSITKNHKMCEMVFMPISKMGFFLFLL